jgi:hypothetical protein
MTLGGHSVLSESKIAPRFNHGHLFLKMVCAGRVTFQQAGGDFTLSGGEMLLVDPVRPFTESFSVPTQLILLMLPKRELRERGIVLEDARAMTLEGVSLTRGWKPYLRELTARRQGTALDLHGRGDQASLLEEQQESAC